MYCNIDGVSELNQIELCRIQRYGLSCSLLSVLPAVINEIVLVFTLYLTNTLCYQVNHQSYLISILILFSMLNFLSCLHFFPQ